MEFNKASGTPDSSQKSEESEYLNTAQIAQRLGVSQSTVARYRSEFVSYLNPYAPPGGGRGYRPKAVEVFKLIRDMKARRATWIEIKQALEAEFGSGESPTEELGYQSFRRSLEAIHQAQMAVVNELHSLLREVNRRLDRLEKSTRQIKSAQKAARERLKEQAQTEPPQPELLFPDKNETGESED